MHHKSPTILCSLICCLALAACSDTAPQRSISYNWDVRPILSDNCFRCHGPDAAARKAGLRLDVDTFAYAELRDSPGRFAIVPGDSSDSELVKRIKAVDPDDRMPPPESHKSLTPEQIDTLTAWVDQGAQYEPHWAYVTPSRTGPPAEADPSLSEIDRFVVSALERQGLTLSPPADKETLINRVSLTLTGLPPTLEEVDAFLADDRPETYGELVERLLDSPAYGEHMAGYWMNLARWADTDGFLNDYHDRLLWPWRDWVIDAFNRNMPFDEFGSWQLAGDLYPSATREQILATTFLRLGRRTTEAGAIDDEYIVEYMVDRTDTLGTAFLGLTVGCARCHDHKYDPISHEDYYSLGAFFHSIDEPGFYAPGFSGIQVGPTLPWTDEEKEAEIAAAEQRIAERQADFDVAYAAAMAEAGERTRDLLDSGADAAALLQRSIESATAAYYSFDEIVPFDPEYLPRFRPLLPAPEELVPPLPGVKRQLGFELAGGAAPTLPPRQVPPTYIREQIVFSPSGAGDREPAMLQSPIVRAGVKGSAIFFDKTNKGALGQDVGWYERTQPFSLDFWFYVGQRYEQPVPVINHRDHDNSGGAGYRLQLRDGRLWFYFAHSLPANMIALHTEQELPVGDWVHITLTYDGSSRAEGTAIYLNGKAAPVVVDRDSLTRTALPRGYGTLQRFQDEFLGLTFGLRFREKAPIDSGIDEIRVFDKALTPLEVRFLHDSGEWTAQRPGLEPLLTEFLASTDPRVTKALHELEAARQAHNEIVSLVPQVPVAGDSPSPRPTFVLERGLYTQPGERVTPRGLQQIFPWDDTLPKSRLGLAQWVFDPEHPLTARVFVNRIWQMHFGTGLVETSEDFGAQGSPPSHPELLDWLAREFVKSGWDVKHLHRLIVTSAVYRQTSDATKELIEADPRNRLLARGPRFRMTARMIRDNALASSGLLSRKIGGESVFPYQPEGVWNESVTRDLYPAPDAVPEDHHHRRSLYSFIKRNAAHPFMKIFDAADPNVSIARTQASNTPLQALELMNDPQFIDAYIALAGHVLSAYEGIDAQLTALRRLATRSTPTAAQLDVLRGYFAAELAKFTAQPEKASALLRSGLSRPDPALDAIRHAAMTNAAALVMNSPDAYSVR